MEALIRTLSPLLNYLGVGVVFVGLIYLGMHFMNITVGRAGEIPKALAIIVAGAVLIAFSKAYS